MKKKCGVTVILKHPLVKITFGAEWKGADTNPGNVRAPSAPIHFYGNEGVEHLQERALQEIPLGLENLKPIVSFAQFMNANLCANFCLLVRAVKLSVQGLHVL